MQGKELWEAGVLSDVVLSTDSPYLLEQSGPYITKNIGLRDEILAGPDIKSIDVVLDALEKLEREGCSYTDVLLLQPTSPLRIREDILGAVNMYRGADADSLVSAYEIPGGTINGIYIRKSDGFTPLSSEHNSGVAHQKLDPLYLRNGAIYISSVEMLRNNRTIIGEAPLVYEMPAERSVDVDSLSDFKKACEYLGTSNVNASEGTADTAAVRRSLECWLYGKKPEEKSKEEWLEWNRVHLYCDGHRVIVDGSCIDGDKMTDTACACERDELTESYIQQCLRDVLCTE